MKILAIDPSLTSLGWCYLNTDKDLRESGTFQSKLKGMERLQEIRNFILSLLKKFRTDIVVIEGYSYGLTVGSRNVDMGELGGVLRLALFESKVRYEEIPPKQLKKYVCGTGNAKKELMLVSCLDKFGVKFTNNDECDAFCLAKFWEELIGLGIDTFLKKHDLKSKLKKESKKVA